MSLSLMCRLHLYRIKHLGCSMNWTVLLDFIIWWFLFGWFVNLSARCEHVGYISAQQSGMMNIWNHTRLVVSQELTGRVECLRVIKPSPAEVLFAGWKSCTGSANCKRCKVVGLAPQQVYWSTDHWSFYTASMQHLRLKTFLWMHLL